MEISKLMFETMRFAVCKAPLTEDFKKEITKQTTKALPMRFHGSPSLFVFYFASNQFSP